MYSRWLIVFVLLIVTWTGSSSGPVRAGANQVTQDLDCDDFATLDEARAAYYADPSDPYDLDGDDNGLPCEYVSSGGAIYDPGEDTGVGSTQSGLGSQYSGFLNLYAVDAASNGIAGACFRLEDPRGIASTLVICDEDPTWDQVPGIGVAGLSTANVDAVVTIVEVPIGYQLSPDTYATQYTGTVRPVDLYFVLIPIPQIEPTIVPTTLPTPAPAATATRSPRATTRSTDVNSDEDPGEDIPDDAVRARVVGVVAGDLIEVEINDERVQVRLLGITTADSDDDESCFGQEALEATRELLQDQTVYLVADETDATEDDELLRYVWINTGDGELVNEVLVEDGYATVSVQVPDLRYAERLTEAQIEAIENDTGLWEACA